MLQTRSENTVLVSISCRLLKGVQWDSPSFVLGRTRVASLKLDVYDLFGFKKGLIKPFGQGQPLCWVPHLRKLFT